MKIEDIGSCDDCGTDTGPFVHFGGGTMASEDCMICLTCIAAAYRGTHSLTMVNGPMAGHRMNYSQQKLMSFRDEASRFHWYEITDWTPANSKTPHFVWLYRGEADSDLAPPEVK